VRNFFKYGAGIALLLAGFAVWAPVALAQTPQLSAEQQRMLDQLPAAQRQQALNALRQMQQQNGAGEQDTSSLAEDVSRPGQAGEGEDDETADESMALRAAPNSRLVINFMLEEDPALQQTVRIDDDPALEELSGSRYYELDRDGVLELAGIASIRLLGLTAEQIELRLSAERALDVFDISVYLLDSPDQETFELEAFGYDVFESEEFRFDPVTTGPVPPDYVLGPGDTVRVQLFGSVNGIYEVEISRSGVLNLPELGPVTVAGMRFSEFREDLNRRVEEMLIGTQVSATMGRLRTIRVFVLGDANRPGSYVVSSLATISSALYASGGISDIGSLRDVQLKRAGEIAGRLDLYDLLLNGDTSDDARLQPGDVIFIPPVGNQVTVSGAVRRPAIYELRGNASVSQALTLAGGLLPDAYPGGARVERIDAERQRVVLSVDTGATDSGSLRVQPGDSVVVPRVLPDFESTVTVTGHLHRPGPHQWFDGMRLTDAVRSRAELRPAADTQYLLIRRESAQDRRIEVVSANLDAALSEPRSEANVRLQPRDRIYVFDLAYGRQRVIEPILEELELQSRYGAPNPIVTITGEVLAPGTYPLESGMRVSDLIRAGGDLAEEAYATRAEIVRYEIVDNETRSTQIIDVDLAAILSGDALADVQLFEHDNLRISGLPEWDRLWTVALEGEVTFPGEYRIRRGETLSELLERAGGLTDAAFPEGAIFLRESLKQQEQEQIEILAQRLQADLTSLSLQNQESTGGDTLATGQQLLAQLRSTEAVGRLVIDLEAMQRSERGSGWVGALELRDDDRLLVPKQAQAVTVIGEVQQTTSHVYRPGLSRNDYINMSGGMTRRADKKLIYVVRANGAVVAGSNSRWFGRGDTRGTDIQPGDTIVVPLETDRIRPLTFWTNVTQILYQAAIAVAAIETFGN